MTDFQGLIVLFTLFKIRHILKKHSTNFAGWGMIESMNELLLESTQNVVVAINFIHVNINEVIVIDNTSWISLHLYVLQGWK
jgi:uncharacterized membrane protein